MKTKHLLIALGFTTLFGQAAAQSSDAVPEGLSPAQRIKWFNNAKATGVFNFKPDVPETDAGKPKTTPQDADLSEMPVNRRIAAGYGKT